MRVLQEANTDRQQPIRSRIHVWAVLLRDNAVQHQRCIEVLSIHDALARHQVQQLLLLVLLQAPQRVCCHVASTLLQHEASGSVKLVFKHLRPPTTCKYLWELLKKLCSSCH
jgi:hypothetical protein